MNSMQKNSTPSVPLIRGKIIKVLRLSTLLALWVMQYWPYA